MLSDTRRTPTDPSDNSGKIELHGLRLVPAHGVVLAAASLFVSFTPGEAVFGHNVTQHRGAILQANAGNTLSDAHELHAAVVAYHNPLTHRTTIAIVDRAEDATGEGSPITGAEIEEVLPARVVAEKAYTLLGAVKWVRAGSAITMTIDHTARSYGVIDEWKASEGNEDFTPDASYLDGAWIPGPAIEVVVNATEFANADLVTDFPINFYGRIRRLVRITEVVIAGAGAVMNVGAEVGSTAVTGLTVASTLADARGTVAQDEPTAPAIVKPGDVVSLIGSGATAGSSGRARFRLEFEVLQP